MNKFEKLIEYIINDDEAKARELFHSIVVEKSRDIYESIMADEAMEETVHGAEVEDLVDEVGCEEEQTMENDEEGEEFDVTGDDGFSDDEVADVEVGGSDVGGETEEDVVLNIDAKLDELLAKFDEIMGDEAAVGGDEFGGEEEVASDEFGGEEEVGAPEGEEQFAEGKNPFAQSGKSGSGSAKSGVSGKSGSGSAKSGKSGKSATELMREYVEKVGEIYGGAGDANEGDAVGASGKKTSVNTKPGSVGPGADFGGEVVKTDTTEQNQDGTSPAAAPKAQDIKSGNRNVPGGKAGNPETTGKSYEKSGDAEGQTTDGKVAVATKSVQKQNTGSKR